MALRKVPMGLESYTYMTMAEVTIPFIESKLTRRRFCAFHGSFHDLDGFSAAQRLAPWKGRYCNDYSNEGRRAAAQIKARPSAEELRAMAKLMKIHITDLPEVEPSRREMKRAADEAAERAEGGDQMEDVDILGDGGGPSAGEKRKQPATSKGKQKAPAASKSGAAVVSRLLAQESLVKWMCSNLPSTTKHDSQEAGLTDENTVRDEKGELVNYSHFGGVGDFEWQTAQDDVRAA